MRRNGIRIAIDDFGTGHSTEERIALAFARYRQDRRRLVCAILPAAADRTLVPAACLEAARSRRQGAGRRDRASGASAAWRSTPAPTCCRAVAAPAALAGAWSGDETLQRRAAFDRAPRARRCTAKACRCISGADRSAKTNHWKIRPRAMSLARAERARGGDDTLRNDRQRQLLQAAPADGQARHRRSRMSR